MFALKNKEMTDQRRRGLVMKNVATVEMTSRWLVQLFWLCTANQIWPRPHRCSHVCITHTQTQTHTQTHTHTHMVGPSGQLPTKETQEKKIHALCGI